LRGEDPARLLDIITNGKECPATVKEINEIIAKVGLQEFRQRSHEDRQPPRALG